MNGSKVPARNCPHLIDQRRSIVQKALASLGVNPPLAVPSQLLVVRKGLSWSCYRQELLRSVLAGDLVGPRLEKSTEHG